MTTLYLDAFAGIAGDMWLAAMCDLGFDEAELAPILAALDLSADAVRVATVRRGALACRKFEFDEVHEHHHHDNHHEHDVHAHDHDHAHQEDAHSRGRLRHTSDGDPAPHEHHHHRPYSQIRDLIASLPYAARVRERAQEAMAKLAAAEAKIHGIEIDRVHFHEVGAEDSIVDVVGVCVALERLGVTRLVCSPLPTGTGFVDCAHGRLPLPAPATLELMRGMPTFPSGQSVEQVTPTAAALLAALADEFGAMPAGVIRAVGYGAGSRDDGGPTPNAVRAVLLDETAAGREAGKTLLVEASIDDMNPQLFPALSDALVLAGALDVCAIACVGKKGRPGLLVRMVVKPDRLDAVSDALFAESTTIGLRFWETGRVVGEREMRTVSTEFGPVGVKITRRMGRIVNVQPEYRDCEAAARSNRVAVKRVMQAASAASLDFWTE
ncbi:MAG: nickel pincer cofactor biosynthesis protein LarC [Deltaproteobacteria bacterium]|nr:nickel pincer cofactor biosynthesis protein LarC [Deltaproteobacteria bacterium]